eukprot:Skav206546  [mRNA]  locus=scaffold504:308454:314438:- [translate_table: standard]
MFTAFQTKMELLEEEAKKVLQNEKDELLQCEGVRTACVDEGGRQVCREIVVDLQETVRKLNGEAKIRIEEAIRQCATSKNPDSAGLAVPCNQPLSWYDPATWPACFTEFVYGDAVPGLDRDKNILFEQLFEILLNRQELSYNVPGVDEDFQPPCANRFASPALICIFADVRRRLALLSSTRAIIARPGFQGDLNKIAQATAADFLEAVNVVGSKSTMGEISANSRISGNLKNILRTLSLCTANIPGTDGRKAAQRHIGHSMNLIFGPCSLFITFNFADTRSSLVYKLYSDACSSPETFTVDLFQDSPTMPSLREMHRLIAQNPRTQAKFFLHMLALHVQHVLGMDGVLSGKMHLVPSNLFHTEDGFATSLRPSLLPFPTACMGPGESQERGFEHAHLKVHGLHKPDLDRMKGMLLCTDDETKKKLNEWRRQGLEFAASLLQQSATETGARLGIHLPPIGFTQEQQKQTRFDGGKEEDGTERPLLEVRQPEQDGHMVQEAHAATMQGRLPRSGMDVPLTGALNSTLPTYRSASGFCVLQKYENNAITVNNPLHTPLKLPWKYFEGAEGSMNLQIVNPNTGRKATLDDIQADAKLFAEAFSRDARACFAINQMHRCVESCVKYSRKKQTKKEQVSKNRAPLCRAGFFHIVEIMIAGSLKKKRRRGKLLQKHPCIDADPASRSYGRVLLSRDHPFLSVSSDVAQVCARCNVDVQFLQLFPPLDPMEEDSNFNMQNTWMQRFGLKNLTPFQTAVGNALTCAFRNMHNIDFYITKYVAKPLSTMKPLMSQLAGAMIRLERELEQQPLSLDGDSEQTKLRAKKTLLKIGNAANTCHWQSATELATVILTGGDMLQTHTVVTVFCKQILFMLHQAKAILRESQKAEPATTDVDIDAVQVSLYCEDSAKTLADDCQEDDPAEPESDKDENDQNSQDSSVDEVPAPQKVQATMRLKTTNMADDYAHRGPHLKDFNYFTYAMFIRRVPLLASGAEKNRLWPFEDHYPLAGTFAQELRYKMSIPRLCSYSCPNYAQNPEENSMMKALLLTPTECPGPGKCHHVARFFPLLGLAKTESPEKLCASLRKKSRAMKQGISFKRNWDIHFLRMRQLADQAAKLERKSQKILVVHDATIFKTWICPDLIQQNFECVKMRDCIKECFRVRALPERAIQCVFTYICCHCVAKTKPEKGECCLVSLHWGHHEEQATLEQIVSHISCNIALNLDLAAEAKNLPRNIQPTEGHELDETDEEPGKQNEEDGQFQLQVEPMGADDEEIEDDLGAVPGEDQCLFPFACSADVLDFALRRKEWQESLKARKCTTLQLTLKRYYAAYGETAFDNRPLTIGREGPIEANQLGYLFRQHTSLALEQQKHFIEQFKAQKNYYCEEDDNDLFPDHSGSIFASTPDEGMPEIVPLPLRFQGPGVVAWELCEKARLNQEQRDVVALVALQLQRMWNRRPPGLEYLPASWNEENLSLLLLGGGGCGKTYTILQVIKPLAELYFGRDGFAGQCPSNAGARLFQGRTVHAALGLSATSSLKVQHLVLQGKTKTKMERIANPAGILAIDEISQLAATMYHANALRHTYARKQKHNLDIANYTDANETFGRMPVLLLSGDFLQLPPVPESGSLLAPIENAAWEHRQGRAIFEKVKHVFEFKQSNRFKDERLIDILKTMRCKGGAKLSPSSWAALEQREVHDPKKLLETGAWFETAYDWATVQIAQQLRTKLAAASSKKILFLIVAADLPNQEVPKQIYRKIQAVSSMTQTKKLMTILPLFKGARVRLTRTILPPELVPEREGTVVGVELHDADRVSFLQKSFFSDGSFLPQSLPKCIWVQFDDLQLELIDPLPCSDHALIGADRTCSHCSFFKGLVGVTPVSAQWTYQEKISPYVPPIKLDVRRVQFPLAPALPKTIYALQGATCRPGLISHMALPKKLSAESKWLAYYVMLSRIESLDNLLCVGRIDRSIIENGPPPRLQEAMDNLFEEKKAMTQTACQMARQELGWPNT